MKVQIHHGERLRWTRSAESSDCFSSATMWKWSLLRYFQNDDGWAWLRIEGEKMKGRMMESWMRERRGKEDGED
ncbi:hypothetical protein CgunFtcFv8_000758 [Champsocephalus gunnari]|uniref:Uncharacterized protein n=1 Tax=Champsocephalus gunnari TaxID=52237 RepID=A0AAN8DMU9_CHAGU|nr:hypothetical protein CgunFtcFv8_000758 [Champsocephalus gunnari]